MSPEKPLEKGTKSAQAFEGQGGVRQNAKVALEMLGVKICQKY